MENNQTPYSYNMSEIKKPVLSKTAIIIIAASLVFSAALLALGMNMALNKMDTLAIKADQSLTKEKSSSAHTVDISDNLRKTAVDKVIADNYIPAYSTSEIMSMDVSKPSGVSVSDLKLVTAGNLVGLEEAFWQAEQDYGVNCLFVMAIASHESANGTICFRPNNMFGFGTSGFSSKAECIDVVSRALANNYLSTNGSLYSGKTISSVNKRYAASTTWDDKVARNMTKYYAVISQNHNSALEKLK
ncbi:MAG: glucosaminidase domain-containing protein [Bacillota bacterium]|nr:glucosaminidase domain-containing protein [Bacillota bacterium]